MKHQATFSMLTYSLLCLLMFSLIVACSPASEPTTPVTSLPSQPSETSPAPATKTEMQSIRDQQRTEWLSQARLDLPAQDELRFPNYSRFTTELEKKNQQPGFLLINADTDFVRRFYAPNTEDYFEFMVRLPYEFAHLHRGREVTLNGEHILNKGSWMDAVPSWLNNDEIWLGEEVYNIRTNQSYPADRPADLDADAVPIWCWPNRDGSLRFHLYEINREEPYSQETQPPQDGRGRCLIYLYHTATEEWKRIDAIFNFNFILYEDLMGAVWNSDNTIFFTLAAGMRDGPADPYAIFKYNADSGTISLWAEQSYIPPFRTFDAEYVLLSLQGRAAIYNLDTEQPYPLPEDLATGMDLFFGDHHGAVFGFAAYGVLWVYDVAQGQVISQHEAANLPGYSGYWRMKYNAPYFTTLVFNTETFKRSGSSSEYALLADVFDEILNPPADSIIEEDSVNLRQEPDLDGAPLRELRANERLRIYAQSLEETTWQEHSEPWYLVKTEAEEIGWVYGAFIPDKPSNICYADPGRVDTETRDYGLYAVTRAGNTVREFRREGYAELFLNDELDPILDASYQNLKKLSSSANAIWLTADEVLLYGQVVFNVKTRSIQSSLPPDLPPGEVVFTELFFDRWFLVYQLAAIAEDGTRYLVFSKTNYPDEWDVYDTISAIWTGGYRQTGGSNGEPLLVLSCLRVEHVLEQTPSGLRDVFDMKRPDFVYVFNR